MQEEVRKMAKGNFTHTGRSTEAISKLRDMYSVELNAYRQLADSRRKQRVFHQEDLTEILNKMLTYIENSKVEKKPLTVSGANLASGLRSDTFRRVRNGDFDYVLEEYIELNEIEDDMVEMIDGLPYANGVLLVPASEVIDWIMMMIQEQREIACSSLRGNPAGNIFLLKSQNGLREEESPQTVNQTLVIADADRAKEALKLLGD